MHHKKYCLIMTTCSKRATQSKIIDAIIEGKLAACIQVVPKVESYYWWQGKVTVDREMLLLIKTVYSLSAQVQQSIKDNHDYHIPQITCVSLESLSKDYANWIDCIVGGRR